jgi:hypothetical protein
MYCAWQKWEVHKIFWLKNLEGIDHFRDVSVDERVILKLIVEKYCVKGVD